MGLFDLFKKNKQLNNSDPTFKEILMPARTEPQPPFLPTEKEPIIATGYETYVRKNLDLDLQHFKNLVVSQQVDKIIMGLPLNMDGTEGDRAIATREFGDKLVSILDNVDIEYIDERLTSVTAEEILIEAGVRREKRKEVIDKLSATLILQDYLDRKK